MVQVGYRLTGMLLGMLAVASATEAAEAFKLSGFASLTAGSVLSGDRDEPLTYNPDTQCPCVLTDWSTNGFYEGSAWTAKPDTKAGLQGVYRFSDTVSATAQLVSRVSEPVPDLTWGFASWEFADGWQLDMGRKRIPLYFYSDFQDVGFAYPWITPPAELYGWETTNYNGAALSYRGRLRGADWRASMFGGRETVKDNPYVETYYTEPTDTQWDNLVGGDLEVSKDWWTVRVVYVQAAVQFDDRTYREKDRSDMAAYGLAFNGDFGDWFFLSEIGQNNRKDTDQPGHQRVQAPAYSLGAGYRFGDGWTIFANTSQYRERSNDQAYEYFRYGSDTVGVRYDLTAKSAVKLQFDKHDDASFDYSGDADLLRVSYDVVF